MKYLLPFILLLGCRFESENRETSHDNDESEKTGADSTPEDTEDNAANKNSTCEDCNYLRFEVELMYEKDEIKDKYEAYIDIRIPKGKLASCELEEMHLCFKEKTLPITYQFIPETLRSAGRATSWDNESKSSKPRAGKYGEPLFRFTHNALYKKDTKFWSWETNVRCSQTHGLTLVMAKGNSPSAGLGIFQFSSKDSLEPPVGKKLDYNPDDTCLLDE